MGSLMIYGQWVTTCHPLNSRQWKCHPLTCSLLCLRQKHYCCQELDLPLAQCCMVLERAVLPWFWKAQGCSNGSNCFHCHLCPDGEISQRKKEKMAVLRILEKTCMKETAPGVKGHAVRAKSKNSPRDVEINEDMMPQISADGDDCIDLLLRPIESESQRISELVTEAPAVEPPLAAEGMPMSVPLPSNMSSPSVGSALHAIGKCKPCAWFHKPQGCSNGDACMHCHICDKAELQNRRKAKINEIKAADGSSYVSRRSK